MNKILQILLLTGILTGISNCYSKEPDLKSIVSRRLKESKLNLIPDKPGNTPSYYCTWSTQGYAVSNDRQASNFGVTGHSAYAEKLTEELIFGKNGAAWAYDKIRKDLFIVYDLGWDIPLGADIEKESWHKGRLTLTQEKFPSCKGTPVEQLNTLNQMTQKAGWRGAGFWVAAEPYEYGRNGKIPNMEQTKAFFEQRAALFGEAGIEYWKVDYGALKGNIEFRKVISEAARKYAPGLFVENCNVDGPLNDAGCPWCPAKVTNTGRFKNWDNGNILKNALAMISFSPVYRTYDVAEIISIPTTLDRVASLLEYYNYPEAGGLINCEDEPNIGAGLGCTLGIMRHPGFSKEKRFDEVVRAVRWQRIAPAYSVKAGETISDTTILTDEYVFKKGETWVDWIYGQKTKQLAPARVARGMGLPTVFLDGEKPFVICSRNPSGAVTVATLPRLAPKGQFFPLADVSYHCKI